jgi:hypothetical protein
LDGEFKILRRNGLEIWWNGDFLGNLNTGVGSNLALGALWLDFGFSGL